MSDERKDSADQIDLAYEEGELLHGRVIKALSGFFTVDGEKGPIIAQLPGRLKKERKDTDIVAVGDWVTALVNEDGTGTIEEVAERESVLSRTRPVARDGRRLSADREQVLVANPDQVVIVFSIKKPRPSLRKLDRFLVVAEMNDLPVIITVNKVDLLDPAAEVSSSEAHEMFRLYEDLGYRTIYTSAKSGEGIQELSDALKDKISVMTGS
ncbi:MAG: GTPase RsgA, partial [Candidatus Promineifilaceae bacterium]